MGKELTVQLVQHDAGLDPGPAFFPVDLDDLVQVLAEIGDYGVVDRLARQAGAAGPGQHRHAVVAGHLHYSQNVVLVPGNHHTHRLHLVDAGVGAVEHSGKWVETHLAGDALPQHLL